jgi:hypothetical protein
MNAFPPTSSTVDLDSATSAPVKGNVPAAVRSDSLNTASCPGVPCTTATLPPPTATQRASWRPTAVFSAYVDELKENSDPPSPDVA